jgi:hypothetical protein
MDPAISRLGGTSSPRRAQVLLKARRERAAETGQRDLPQRVAQSGSGGESGGGNVVTSVLSDGTVDLGSNTQGGDGDGVGVRKGKGKRQHHSKKMKKKGGTQRRTENRAKKRRMGSEGG